MSHRFEEEKLKVKNALRIKKSLEKEMDDHNLGDNSSESEEIDFKKVIHPIGYYINDREQMIEEMFSIISGEKLRKMLPPILKNWTLEELKADCLVHLLGMSKKRIMATLEGRELNSSSDSESESSKSSSETDEATLDYNKRISKTSIDQDDLLDISVSKNEVDDLIKGKSVPSYQHSKKRSQKKKKIKLENAVPLCSIVISDDDTENKSTIQKRIKTNPEYTSNKLDEILGQKEQVKKRKKIKKANKSSTGVCSGQSYDEDGNTEQNVLVNNETIKSEIINDKGKTLLEILELEMRARAIRALLKNTPNPEDSVCSLSGNMKSETDKLKSDSSITDNNSEMITSVNTNQVLSKETEITEQKDELETFNDIEIIDNVHVDLCVTIDDDNDDDVSLTKIPLFSEDQVEDSGKHDSSKSNKIGKVDDDWINSTKNLNNDSAKTAGSNTENVEKNSSGSRDDLTWSERWAENKNVREVVKNSKICANIRKRMRFARMLKQKQLEENQQKDRIDLSNVEESSVAHYNLIKAQDRKNQLVIPNVNDKLINNPNDIFATSVNNLEAKNSDSHADGLRKENHNSIAHETDSKTLILDVSDDDITSL